VHAADLARPGAARAQVARVESVAGSSGFRLEFHNALTARRDALFELTDALWIRASTTGANAALVDVLRQAYLRRFDLEHTVRMLKRTCGCPGRSRPIRAG
jgi:hypothetical protein